MNYSTALCAVILAFLHIEFTSGIVSPGAPYRGPDSITGLGVVNVELEVDEMYFTSGHVDYMVSVL